VRDAQLDQYNYILVVGEEEASAGTVNVRTRDNKVHGMHSIADLITVLKEERDGRSLTSMFEKEETPGAGEGAAPKAEAAAPAPAAPADA
jgi:threonyl-tRNA synthetase